MTGLEPATSGVTGRGKVEENQWPFQLFRPETAFEITGFSGRIGTRGINKIEAIERAGRLTPMGVLL